MFCGKCGKEVSEGTKLCPHCGEAVNNQSTPTEVQSNTPTVTLVENSTVNKVGSNDNPAKVGKLKKLIIYVAVAVALFLGFGAIVNTFDSTPDWLDKIPVIPVTGNTLNLFSSTGSQHLYSIQYSEIPSDDIIMYGIANSKELEHYKLNKTSDAYVSFRGQKAVYAEGGLPDSLVELPVKFHKEVADYEPLIARTENGTCLFLYRAKNEQTDMYLIYVMKTPNDLSISYLSWRPLYRIEVADASYCAFLNGEQKLEVISIPD